MSEHDCLKNISWETRNLGTQSFALSEQFIESPDEELLKYVLLKTEQKHGRIFVQARLDKKYLSITPIIERNGFYFVESTLVPYTSLNKNSHLAAFIQDRKPFIPLRYDVDALGFFVLDKGDKKQFLKIREIATESFTDDRFHIDRRCSKTVADFRFVYWVDDLLSDESVVFHILEYRGDAIGFMASKDNNLILAGFAHQYIKSGLGEYLWYAVLQDLQNRGIVQVHTLISSNNTAVLNLYARMGFRFKDPAATFHYWSN